MNQVLACVECQFGLSIEVSPRRCGVMMSHLRGEGNARFRNSTCPIGAGWNTAGKHGLGEHRSLQ